MTIPNHRKKLSQKLPHRDEIFASRWAKPFAPMFDKPYFWTLNRRQAAVSVAVGLFCGLMPGPTQMLSALMVAYFLRTNLPVALFTTLYTNPLTYMPLYYAAYRIGASILGKDSSESLEFPSLDNNNFISESWNWLLGAGKPLLVGVPTLGITLAIIGYIGVLWIWRLRTTHKWHKRRGKNAK